MSSPWPGHAPAPSAPPYGAAQPYGSPPPGQYPPYGYQPYGPPPAGMGGGGFVRAPRPGTMVLGLVLQIICALLSVLGGCALLIAGSLLATRPDVLDDVDLGLDGVDPATAVLSLQILGGLFAVAAVLFLVFAIMAFRGGRVSRVLVTLLTAGYLLLSVLGGTALTWVLAVLGVIGAVLLFTPAAGRFFANPRLR